MLQHKRLHLPRWLQDDTLAPTARRLHAQLTQARAMATEEAMHGTTWVPFWLEREKEAMDGLVALLKEAVLPSRLVV